jgi:hypothetical protein
MAVEPQDPHYCQGNMDELGPLPMLFDEDLNAFEFDQTFTGDTDGALDRFFADVFCLPSFPRPRRPDSPSLPVDASWRSWSAFRDYRSDDDVYVSLDFEMGLRHADQLDKCHGQFESLLSIDSSCFSYPAPSCRCKEHTVGWSQLRRNLRAFFAVDPGSSVLTCPYHRLAIT